MGTAHATAHLVLQPELGGYLQEVFHVVLDFSVEQFVLDDEDVFFGEVEADKKSFN